MSIFEFDREEYEKQVREEEREEVEAKCLAKGRKEGALKTLYELVKDSLLSLANAAKKAGQSEEEFAAGMESYFLRGRLSEKGRAAQASNEYTLVIHEGILK